jgi:hypothetical protein
MGGRIPVNMIDWMPNTDLRYVSQTRLQTVLAENNITLEDGQGALFSNAAEDRFRAVFLLNGQYSLLIAPVNARTREDLTSAYLKTALWVRQTFKARSAVFEWLKEEDGELKGKDA